MESHFESYKITGRKIEAKTIDYFCEKIKQVINQKLEEMEQQKILRINYKEQKLVNQEQINEEEI